MHNQLNRLLSKHQTLAHLLLSFFLRKRVSRGSHGKVFRLSITAISREEYWTLSDRCLVTDGNG